MTSDTLAMTLKRTITVPHITQGVREVICQHTTFAELELTLDKRLESLGIGEQMLKTIVVDLEDKYNVSISYQPGELSTVKHLGEVVNRALTARHQLVFLELFADGCKESFGIEPEQILMESELYADLHLYSSSLFLVADVLRDRYGIPVNDKEFCLSRDVTAAVTHMITVVRDM
jgi:acyl carrier protein